jgi:hypothetical protein
MPTSSYGGFDGHGGTPIAGYFLMENLIKIDDLRIPLIEETLMWLWLWINTYRIITILFG